MITLTVPTGFAIVGSGTGCPPPTARRAVGLGTQAANSTRPEVR